MPRLLHELAVGYGDGSYTRLLSYLAKLDLLAIDIGQGLVEKDHLDVEARELFENQDLIGVLARPGSRAHG